VRPLQSLQRQCQLSDLKILQRQWQIDAILTKVRNHRSIACHCHDADAARTVAAPTRERRSSTRDCRRGDDRAVGVRVDAHGWRHDATPTTTCCDCQRVRIDRIRRGDGVIRGNVVERVADDCDIPPI